ncbi:MAG: hypothetical protein JWM04_1010, partial [Verrucomicrobiales bacterium]|nr:hypothetical protein [Verrucomicrobiales bacterium]
LLLQQEGKVILHLEKSEESIFRVSIGESDKPSEAELGFEDPLEMTKGGTARWTTVSTRGKLGTEPGAFQVDTLTIPESNPFDSWMRLTAVDFFKDGSAAISTMSGEVWIVSGIDRSLRMLSWKRFATGLYETLGLKIVNGQIYVLGKDRITKLVDVNNDGEADYYESFNSHVDVYPTYHAYSFDLQTDSKTNFYFVTDGNMVDPDLPYHGSLVQVSADGKYANIFATGMRAANGMGIGPEDQITTADNQGHWTPACRINWIKQGGFYGYGGDPRQTNLSHPLIRKTPTTYDPPLCWIPMNADNSSGSQVWVTGNKWGPLKNHMLHLSYGKGTLFAVMPEISGGVAQGGVVQFPLKFGSGMMRGRFSPADGQLYVCGMKGWQTSAVRDGALQRVRYTGKPTYMPMELHVKGNAITIVFSDSLDKTQAQDAGNYAVEQWNYHWTSTYGSDNYSVENPAKKGTDKLEVKSVQLKEDGKTVVLTMEKLQPVMQMKIKYQMKAADQTDISQEIYNTINID